MWYLKLPVVWLSDDQTLTEWGLFAVHWDDRSRHWTHPGHCVHLLKVQSLWSGGVTRDYGNEWGTTVVVSSGACYSTGMHGSSDTLLHPSALFHHPPPWSPHLVPPFCLQRQGSPLHLYFSAELLSPQFSEWQRKCWLTPPWLTEHSVVPLCSCDSQCHGDVAHKANL